jgi:hypothetical protein
MRPNELAARFTLVRFKDVLLLTSAAYLVNEIQDQIPDLFAIVLDDYQQLDESRDVNAAVDLLASSKQYVSVENAPNLNPTAAITASAWVNRGTSN